MPALQRVPDGSLEPVVTNWAPTDVAAVLVAVGFHPAPPPFVLAVNGRSGGGKSTLTRQLAAAVPGSAIVEVDDVSWHYTMFDWSTAMIENVVEPVRRGAAVHYRPPGWVERDRPGEVAVKGNRSLLLIEGVGSSQTAMTAAIDASIWVQSDAPTARELGIGRDIALGVNGDADESVRFWDQWMEAENPFQDRDRPWERADLVLAGVPLSIGPQLYVAAPDSMRSRSRTA